MGVQTCFHAVEGHEFLGLRISRKGELEIVYDNGPKLRKIWRVLGGDHCDGPNSDLTPADEARLTDALRIAVCAARVLPTLHVELKKRALVLESLLG
jgi:hypothetical protein